MEELQKILKSFSELRDKYSDIETAIEAVCIDTGLDRERVLGVINVTGVYVSGSEEEEIKKFIRSASMIKTTVKELRMQVGFRFCISNREAERLVHKWFNTEDIQ